MIEKAEGNSFKVSRPPLAYFSKPCLGYGGSCCLINQVGHVTCLFLYPGGGGGESHTTPRPFPQQRIGSSPDKWEDIAFLMITEYRRKDLRQRLMSTTHIIED